MQKPIITEHEDGSIDICFLKESARFSICLENNLSESSWNYVDKNWDMQCDLLPDKMIEYLEKFYAKL